MNETTEIIVGGNSLELLQAHADKQGKTVQQVFDQAVTDYLDKLEISDSQPVANPQNG